MRADEIDRLVIFGLLKLQLFLSFKLGDFIQAFQANKLMALVILNIAEIEFFSAS